MQGDAPTQQADRIGNSPGSLEIDSQFECIHTCSAMFSGIWALRSIDSSIRRQVDIPIHATVICLRRLTALPEQNP